MVRGVGDVREPLPSLRHALHQGDLLDPLSLAVPCLRFWGRIRGRWERGKPQLDSARVRQHRLGWTNPRVSEKKGNRREDDEEALGGFQIPDEEETGSPKKSPLLSR